MGMSSHALGALEATMARAKKVEVKMPVAAAAEVKTKPVRLDLDAELHKRLRIVAAEAGKPMAVFARDLVEETVNRLYGSRARS